MHTGLASLPAAPLPLGPAAVLAGALQGAVAPRQVQSRADPPPTAPGSWNPCPAQRTGSVPRPGPGSPVTAPCPLPLRCFQTHTRGSLTVKGVVWAHETFPCGYTNHSHHPPDMGQR